MKLDLLQNPPLTQEENAFFFSQGQQNLPPISQTLFKRNQKDLQVLSEYFGGESGGNFSFLSGSFAELFLSLHLKKRQIAFALSNHQQAYEAYHLCTSLFPISVILPDLKSGVIESLEGLEHCDTFIIPLINEDLLTHNDIQKLINSRPDALFIIDISYGVRFALTPSLTPQCIFLCNAESLGILRGHGVFLCAKEHLQYFPRTRYTHGLYAQMLHLIKSQTPPKDHKEEFFSLLSSEGISLFAPLSSSLPNTLALRMQGIQARTILQSLQIEGIKAINGAECLFGFSSPSFVLQEMGYTELQARELLSVSFEKFDPQIPLILKRHYQQLKILEV